MIRRLVAVTILAAGLGTSAAAAAVSPGALPGGLHVAVSGTPGSGTTSWSFSGTSTAIGALKIDDDDRAVGLGWVVGDAFYAGTDQNIDFTASAATLTDGATTYTIEGVGAQDWNPDTVFGLAIEDGTNTANFQFADGTALTASGSATAPIDISAFAPGTTGAVSWNNRGQLADAELGVTFEVTPTPVPLPATLPMLAGGIAVVVAARRRRG